LFELCGSTNVPTQKRSDPVGQDGVTKNRIIGESQKTIPSEGSGPRGGFQCFFRQNGRTIR